MRARACSATWRGAAGRPAVAAEWLGTGDLGHFDDGFLVLHGRRKHQFITAYGRNVNPEWVEAELVQRGARSPRPGCMARRSPRTSPCSCRRADCSDVELDAAVAAANAGLPTTRAHRWLRAEAPFTPANGLLTANGRLRRAALAAHYHAAAPMAASWRPSPLQRREIDT